MNDDLSIQFSIAKDEPKLEVRLGGDIVAGHDMQFWAILISERRQLFCLNFKMLQGHNTIAVDIPVEFQGAERMFFGGGECHYMGPETFHSASAQTMQ